MMVVVGGDGINGNIMQGREHRRESLTGRKNEVLAMLTHFYGSLTNNINNSDSSNYNPMV